jgi:hypothetical protein
MAYTTTQLAALQAALASGELSVEYDGKKVGYRSVAELERAISVVQGALEAGGTLASTPRRSVAAYSRD